MIAAPRGYSQVSPGPLSKPHESLAGPLQCTKCHELNFRDKNFKCMQCHTEIRERVTKRIGMHAVWVPPGATGKDCVTCHSDHFGPDFQLIRWQPNREALDHSKTAFPLEGKHASVGCNSCHKPANMLPSEKAGILVKDLTHTYLGLSPDCVSCHADEHRGQLSMNCATCHTAEGWKPASVFNHSSSKYSLIGAHAAVACDKCHETVADAKPYVKYIGLSFDKCTDCHADPHKSTFTVSCQSCHNTTSWTQELRLESFDHSKTKYPLLGKHQIVVCARCHTDPNFKTPVPHAKCVDCHNPDPHGGQFVSRASKGECAECHTERGWIPNSFGVKEHATSAYPLLGKHAAVECAKCHIPAGAGTIYKVKFAQCKDCHQDAHDGQFAKAPYEDRCESCHTVNDFHRSTFSIAMHDGTRFPLQGAHAVVPCDECHKLGADGRHDKILPFHFKDLSCAACHMDPHRGEFNARVNRAGAKSNANGCEACHNVRSWTDTHGFDHMKTDFPLLGAHLKVDCKACHPAPAGAGLTSFKVASKNCEYCHEDVHGGQFTKSGETPCKDCHTSERWSPSTFDHERTPFPLTGGHTNVSCSACHTEIRLVGGHAVIVYSLAPSECAACHSTPPK